MLQVTDCPCGFGRDISFDESKCPVCGMDVTPLHRVHRLPQALFEDGLTLVRDGGVNDGIDLLMAARALSGDEAATSAAIGDAYARADRFTDAAQEFERALERQPNDAAIRDRLAAVRRDQAARDRTIAVASRHRLIVSCATTFVVALLATPLFGMLRGRASDVPALAQETQAEIARLEGFGAHPVDVRSVGRTLHLAGVLPSSLHRTLALYVAQQAADRGSGGSTPVAVDGSALRIVLSAPDTSARAYLVRHGDTLRQLAERFYGDADLWRRIYAANPHMLGSPSLLRDGEILAIPPARAP